MKYFKKIIRPLLLVVTLAILGWFIYSHWSELTALNIVSPMGIFLSAILVLFSLYSAGMVNELTIEPHGVKPTKLEVFGLASITRFLNQVAPNYVGASVRAMYFKRHYGVSFTKFSSSFIVANMLQIIVVSFIATTSYILFVNGLESIQNLAVVFVSTLILIAVLLIPARPMSNFSKKLYKRYNYRVFNNLSVLLEEYAKVRAYPRLFIRMIFWMGILTFISALIINNLFAALGYDTTLGVSLFISAMANLSIILSITPAGIGIREGAIIFGGSLAGIPIAVSLAVSLLLRVVLAVVTGLLSLVFSRKMI